MILHIPSILLVHLTSSYPLFKISLNISSAKLPYLPIFLLTVTLSCQKRLPLSALSQHALDTYILLVLKIFGLFVYFSFHDLFIFESLYMTYRKPSLNVYQNEMRRNEIMKTFLGPWCPPHHGILSNLYSAVICRFTFTGGVDLRQQNSFTPFCLREAQKQAKETFLLKLTVF